MYDEIKNKVRELLGSEEIQGFLALKQDGMHVGPHLFVDPDEVEHLVIGDVSEPGRARYPVLKIMQTLLHSYPEARFGVLLRGCDERHLKALVAWNQISADRVVPVGVACPQALAEACQCMQPYPENYLEGKPAEPVQHQALPLEEAPPLERWSSWLHEFEKCIKCYGCRNICPMCFCNECALESEDVVSPGEIPPEFPMFHLVRAVHMIGRCVDCGLCEEACPVNIPLRSLYKKVNEIVFAHFQFRPGFGTKERSPLHEVPEPPPTR
ncbi:MAG: 4Fe-4S binding protein [Syntrophobacteria bacterium]